MSLRQSGSTLLNLTGRKCARTWRSLKTHHIAEAQWYEIDETTHGSVVTYHSKEAYETNLATQKEYRAQSVKERSVQMLHEAHGECHSELSSL